MPLKPTAAMRKDRRAGNKASTTMQHRHFAFIASVIAGLPDHAASLRAQKASVTSAFAQALEKTNPNFDRSRFFNAVGIADPVLTEAAYGDDPKLEPEGGIYDKESKTKAI